MIGILATIAFLGASQSNTQAPPTAPPPPSIRSTQCRCPANNETGLLSLEGIVVDAEVTLSADGLSPADRQATIFNVTSSSTDIEGRTRIWHATKPSQCGVTFDYGKKYSVVARETAEGFETDACLMRSKAVY